MNAPIVSPRKLRTDDRHAPQPLPQSRAKRGGTPTAALSVSLLLLGALGVFAAWWMLSAPDPLADVLTAPVVRGDIEVTVLATGTVRPVKLVAVGAQASGRLTAMRVAVGQSVKKGELIAEIDNLNQKNALKTAEAMLASAQAQLREKQAMLARFQSVLAREDITLAQKATSRDSYENAQMQVKTTQAQIEFIETQLAISTVAVDSAKVNLGYTNIVAPMDGTVLLVVTQEGQTVNANQTAPTIVVLGQLDRMTIRTEISEADIAKVRPGLPVYFTILGDPIDRWDGRLAAIDPAPDSIRSDSDLQSTATASPSGSSSQTTSSAIYYYGSFEVPNRDGRLLTYMTAQVRIVIGTAKGVLTVPTSAVSPPDPKGQRSVEVVDGHGRITRRAVTTGLDDKVRIEIRSGLSEDDRVVTTRKSALLVKASSLMRPPPPPPGF